MQIKKCSSFIIKNVIRFHYKGYTVGSLIPSSFWLEIMIWLIKDFFNIKQTQTSSAML